MAELAALVERVRGLGRWPGLTDDDLAGFVAEAQAEVAADLARLGLALGEDDVDRLVALKACELASRVARPPTSESAGGLSASYLPLNWAHIYARTLNRYAAAHEVRLGGVM